MPLLQSPLNAPIFGPLSSVLSGAGAPSMLAAGALVAFIGDSILEYNHNATTGTGNLSLTVQPQGELVMCQALDPRFNLDTWLSADTYDSPYNREFYGANNGYAGQTSTTALSRKLNVLSQGADLYIWAAGTNDGLENAPAQVTAVANAQSFANDVIAAGKRLLIIGVRPTGTSQNTAQRIAGRKTVNTGLASIAAANVGKVDFIDLWAAYDPNADDIVDVGFMADALHPTAAGAYAASSLLLPKLQSIISAGDIMALNGNAELITNPFSGSGGTNSIGANLTGTIPAGWTVEYQSGTTAVVVSSVSGGVWTLAVTPGASASVVRVRPTTNVTTVNGTDWLKLMADVEAVGGGNIRARLEDNLSTANYYANGMLIDPTAGPSRAKSLIVPWMARSTAVRPCVFIGAPAGGAAFTAKIYSMSLKKQTSPKTQRNAGSVPTVNVAPTAPTGTLTVGSTLTANDGTWNQNNGAVALTLAYRWYRNGTFLGSSLGTSKTYVAVAGDSGTTITCGVSAANAAGRGAESVSPGVVIA